MSLIEILQSVQPKPWMRDFRAVIVDPVNRTTSLRCSDEEGHDYRISNRLHADDDNEAIRPLLIAAIEQMDREHTQRVDLRRQTGRDLRPTPSKSG